MTRYKLPPLKSWQLPKVKKFPPGYHKVSVFLTSRELERFKGAAALQPHGTYSEAIRRAMGMTPNPHRFRAALIDQALREAADALPHSRACGTTPHDHGPDCARDCPSCWPHVHPNNEE